MLYDEDKLNEELTNFLNSNGGFLKKMPTNIPVKVKVYVYIIKVSILNPLHLIGKFEPFIQLDCGETEIKTEKFRTNSIEPLIGKCFEFEARFPHQSHLNISIKNWNLLEGTELIGETTIDLEDRFYSNCYATCGLPKKFELNGYNSWRDMLTPKQILSKFCKKFGFQRPKFSENRLTIYDSSGFLITELPSKASRNSNMSELNESNSTSASENDSNMDQLRSEDEQNHGLNHLVHAKINKYEEQLALDALNNWKQIAGVELVPEHVETRSLYNSEAGAELEQGKIQMWIDMFPISDFKLELLPKPVDVSVRKPKKFQLRVVILNTKDVELNDLGLITGEKSSDIYVKGFLLDQMSNSKRTDVHYRSLNGEGNFNWRFIFNLEYLPAEKRMVFTHKQKFGLVSTEKKLKPVLILQCYDADQFSADDLLGQLELNLCKFIKGASSAENCSLRMVKDKKWPKLNMFKTRQNRGWWPFVATNPDKSLKITGKLEAEFKLMSEKEAEEQPAGEARAPPDPLMPPE